MQKQETEVQEGQELFTIPEIFSFIFSGLAERFNSNISEIEIWNEISNDNDHHRSRSGEIKYRQGFFVEVNRNYFAILFGDETSGYPADSWECEIVAVPVNEESYKKEDFEFVKKVLNRSSTYFRYSLLASTIQKLFVLSEGSIFSRLFGSVFPEFQEEFFKIEDKFSPPEYDESSLSLSTLSAPVTKKARHIRKCADIFTDVVEQVLKNARGLKIPTVKASS